MKQKLDDAVARAESEAAIKDLRVDLEKAEAKVESEAAPIAKEKSAAALIAKETELRDAQRSFTSRKSRREPRRR